MLGVFGEASSSYAHTELQKSRPLNMVCKLWVHAHYYSESILGGHSDRAKMGCWVWSFIVKVFIQSSVVSGTELQQRRWYDM